MTRKLLRAAQVVTMAPDRPDSESTDILVEGGRIAAIGEHLDPAGFTRMLAWLDIGDPDGEVATAYLAKELLRESFTAVDVFDARRRLTAFYDHCHSSDVAELERLARG